MRKKHLPTLPNRCVPLSPQGLCFNGSAFVLYLSAAVVDASSVSPEREGHNFNSWAASSVSDPLIPHPPTPHPGIREEDRVICAKKPPLP